MSPSVGLAMRTRRVHIGWRQKVNFAFIRWSLATKTNRALSKISEETERTKAWKRNYKEMCVASRLINAERVKIKNPEFQNLEITKPLDGEVWPWPVVGEPGKAYITNPESCSFFRYLVFLKYGITFRELVCQVERDPSAYRKLMRVHEDYRRFRWGTSLDSLRMKFNLTHFQMIVQGFDFGLRELGEEELAECLDEICPCSQRHSSDYLKKLRTRIIKACRGLSARNGQSTTTN